MSCAIGRETLRRWMVAEGLWLSRQQRKTFHQPRLRRERYGELVQIDGSEHRWFEQRGEPCTLLVFIDDATSKLMQLRFVPSESTSSYFEALQGYLESHGCPVAFYSDKHSVFRVNRDAPRGPRHDAVRPCAGRVEHRDPLRELQPGEGPRGTREPHAAGPAGEGASARRRSADVEAGNDFLPAFMERFNERFAVVPREAEDLHRSLSVRRSRLNDILCHREQRYVERTAHLPLRPQADHPGAKPVSEELGGQYVELYDFPDRPLEVRWKGVSLPYRVFSKDQRVSHAAIVENKRLGHALAIVKAQQDLRHETKVMTNSEKTGYKKRVKRTYDDGVSVATTAAVDTRGDGR